MPLNVFLAATALKGVIVAAAECFLAATALN
jgi:hypothetical protein